MFSINNTTNSAGCSYVVTNQIDLSQDSTPCGCNVVPGDDGPDDFLEPQVAYIYWDGCCQYICKGEYTLDADGNEVLPENWTENFAQDGGVLRVETSCTLLRSTWVSQTQTMITTPT